MTEPMKAVHGLLVLPLLVQACSLAYLTDHAGQPDSSPAELEDGGTGGSRDASATEGIAMGEDASAIDGNGAAVDGAAAESEADGAVMDARWTSWADATNGFADLAAVWGSGPGDVWAVGYNMIVHWDGTTWSISPANVGPLNGIWGSSRSDVWAVGQGGAVFHYDSVAWVPSDASTSATLNGVWGTGPDDVWSVGEADGGGAIVHWDGHAWTLAGRTDAGLQAVWGSSGSVWAAGSESSIWFYDGGSWTAQSDLASVQEVVSGIWGSSPTSVWAVAQDGPLLFHGGQQDVWAPVVTGFGLKAIWGAAAQDVWSVGFGGLILHYDGTAWTQIASGTSEGLNGVWGSGSDDVWIVGTGGAILHHP
jgi:hypothetical protein